jgi:glycosyltransferase involved in cell wall biosynthesis
VEYFLRALPLILREVEAEAVLIGDGPERERLLSLAEELGVTHRVYFLGKRAHAEMPGLLSSADLAVIPSLMEATSVAALEAMACELPVVASDVGGLPEIIDQEVGALFKAGDPEALAAEVVRLLGDRDLREKGASARKRVVARWSNDRLVDRHLEIYSHLLHGRG